MLEHKEGQVFLLRKKRWWRALCLALVLSLGLSLSGMVTFAEDCGGIQEQVLRLHVLAHSDKEADQALKLKVRDAVVAEASGMLDGVTDKKTALATVRRMLPRLTETAQACVLAAGYSYPVRAELCEMYFTTRTYETGTLPAGVYSALRVTIGEGAGRNWWCVVYPSMCLSAAGNRDEWSDVLDKRQTDIVEHPERYRVRLKIWEWIGSLWENVSSWW